jgi:hypothetical protein
MLSRHDVAIGVRHLVVAASLLASLPPELDVSLPVREELPVVAPESGVFEGLAELAAGSPVTEPRPLGPPCAWARFPESAIGRNCGPHEGYLRLI